VSGIQVHSSKSRAPVRRRRATLSWTLSQTVANFVVNFVGSLMEK
jgi:hypothetical protein